MSPDFDINQADQETIDALIQLVQQERNLSSDLVNIIHDQDAIIARLRTRMQEHRLHVLEKSVVETSREELERINASIPPCRTERAKNKEKMPFPLIERQTLEAKTDALHRHVNMLDSFANMLNSVDLESYGIDPQTMCFKPGWGPNGRLPPPTMWQRVKSLFK